MLPALMAAAASLSQAGTIGFIANVNTSTLNGTSGFVDFQFNRGNNPALNIAAVISGFAPNSLTGSPANSGDVTGTLPGTVTINNTAGFNEYFQGINFGNSISFLLTLTGPGVGGSAAFGSDFGIALFDSAQNPVLTSDPNGFIGIVDIAPNGSVSTTQFPNGNQRSVITLTQTPEPGTCAVAGLGLAVLTLCRKRRSS